MKDARQLYNWQKRQEKKREIKQSRKYYQEAPVSGVLIEISINRDMFDWVFRARSYEFWDNHFRCTVEQDPLERLISNRSLTTLVYVKEKELLGIFIYGIKMPSNIKNYLKYMYINKRPTVLKIDRIREVRFKREKPGIFSSLIFSDLLFEGHSTDFVLGIEKLINSPTQNTNQIP